jgi:hypothetical protein
MISGARGWLALAVLVAAVTLAALIPVSALGDPSVDFVNLTPAAGTQIAYGDWIGAGQYVQFTIKPDSNYPCASEPYWLDINGQRAVQFSAACTASVFLSTPGTYSWSTTLFIFVRGTAITDSASTVTIDNPPPVTAPVVVAPSADITPPRVRALATSATVGQVAHLLFTASDKSGASTLFFVVIGHGRTGWKKTLADATVRSGVRYSVAWRPASAGLYAFCLAAVDATGNKSATSCAAVTVRLSRSDAPNPV